MAIGIPVIVIAIGLVLIFVVRPNSQNKIMNMELTKTTTIEELVKEFSGMEDGYRQMVELKETAYSSNILQAPFSKQNVIYYEITIHELVKMEVQSRDLVGNISTKTDKERDLVFEDRSSSSILLKDSTTEHTVSIEIPEGMDIPETYSRTIQGLQARAFFENSEMQVSSNILNKLGIIDPHTKEYEVDGKTIDLVYNLAEAIKKGNNVLDKLGISSSRTKEYEVDEKAIKQGDKLYILGEALKRGNEVFIVKPEDNSKPYIISTKSEEELTKSMKFKSRLFLILGIALIILGISMFL